MLAFYAMYPQYAKLDVYIIGESFAGHYVPAIGPQAIVQSNSSYAKNLKGIAIGNGWVYTKVWPVAFYECQLIELLVLTTSELKLGRSINPYDVRQPCKVPPLL